LRTLGAVEEPEISRTAATGSFLIEVCPALALASLNRSFATRLGAPKYNPANRKKFRLEHWQSVAQTVADVAKSLLVDELADWALEAGRIPSPRKSDQDMLDSAICSLIGLIWKICDRGDSAMIGDLETGYMITPIADWTRPRLEAAAGSKGVSLH
jgi:predicted RNase H-like nuclease